MLGCLSRMMRATSKKGSCVLSSKPVGLPNDCLETPARERLARKPRQQSPGDLPKRLGECRQLGSRRSSYGLLGKSCPTHTKNAATTQFLKGKTNPPIPAKVTVSKWRIVAHLGHTVLGPREAIKEHRRRGPCVSGLPATYCRPTAPY